MAYCLRSLVQILEQVVHPEKHYQNWVLDNAKIPQIQSLLEIATFLRDFFDNTSPLILESMESLEDQIMEAAGKAEDTLESHITDQIRWSPAGQSFMISPPDLREVLRVFEVAKKMMIKVKAAGKRWSDVSPPSSSLYPDSKNMVVGVAEDLKELRSRLTARASELNIIPIVGMGGSGKTTLARILYDEHSSDRSSHFDCCAWVTVSQTYDPKKILQSLVDLAAKSLNGMPAEDTDLIVTLHKTLFGRRYLIVLDDIRSCQAWDDFQRAFPQNNNRSRIIMTTRESTLANHVNLNSHQMHVLSKDDSWKLLSGKVFGEQSCPHELENAGKKIASNCGGLPLALQVIGGLLSQSEKSEIFWEHVAYNVSSLIFKTDDHFSGIFNWSFLSLPHYLKPCFLYMGAFLEDRVIKHSTITDVWVAEGFLYPIPNKSLEEAAEIHLNALVDRNLIFVHKRKSNGKAKSYGMHDLLRDLCLRKAQKTKFIYLKDFKTNILQEDTLSLRRIIVQLPSDKEKDKFESLEPTPLARSFVLTGDKKSDRFVRRLCFNSTLLRVLRASPSTISKFHNIFLKLVNLRYISLWIEEDVVPQSICMLRNLHTLIVRSLESIIILEGLPQLRHLKFKHLEQTFYERPFSVHENLQSISFIPLETLSSLLGKVPNLRKLGINGRHSNDNIDFTCFQKLETLYYKIGYEPDNFCVPNSTIFADSIKKLSLRVCIITQTLLDAIGVLPNLQILKFNYVGFVNNTLEPSEDGFLQLQYLKFRNSHLEIWRATDIHFPVLRHLVLEKCRNITEIPSDIGGIETLEIIEVDECKTSVFESARRIRDEQIQFGNNLLQLRLGHSLEDEKEGEEDEIKAMVKNNALELRSYTFRSTTILPKSLKSLRLVNCVLSQTSLHAIGILPRLEFLKLNWCEFESLRWEPSQGGFYKLQCLKIKGYTLEKWVATEIHFPVLQRLVLKECFDMKKIPNRIGRIETLKSIKVDRCYTPLSNSAKRIIEEQRKLGNTLLQLQLGTVVEYEVEEDEGEEEGSVQEVLGVAAKLGNEGKYMILQALVRKYAHVAIVLGVAFLLLWVNKKLW